MRNRDRRAEPENKRLARIIRQAGINKAWLARKLEINRAVLYSYLAPERHPTVRLSDERRAHVGEQLDQFVRSIVTLVA